MSAPSRWIFRNAARRPVELHLKEGVVVIPPGGTIATDEQEPHCAALERRGVLTRHAAPEPPEAERQAEDGGKTRPRSRSGGQKKSGRTQKEKRGSRRSRSPRGEKPSTSEKRSSRKRSGTQEGETA